MHPFEKYLRTQDNSLLALSVRGALWFASFPYQAAVLCRNKAYEFGWIRSHRPGVPVISVGNLTAGGTGKTPACVWIAKWLRERDHRVAILSRGYGALADGLNDEAREIETLLPDVPHLQASNRIETSGVAVEELQMQILVLDDGFQHRRLARDLDIVLLDATNPFGWGYLLPRGLLREPLKGLRRADLVIVTRSDQVSTQELASLRTKVQRANPKAGWVESIHSPVRWRNASGESLPLESLSGKPAMAVSGIGNPNAFLKTLKDLSIPVIEQVLFPDHHPYSPMDVRGIIERASQCSVPPQSILCTGKDLAKFSSDQLGQLPLWALEIELKIVSGAEVLQEYLERVCQSIPDDSQQA
ncbi:MAG: tetraacyldisaccharide 4'-kinase [Pirellula sp.]|jgi:tetraacyldisaccharide 4'-kinase